MANHGKVWYVSYGSNLLEERFLKYIQGGEIDGCAQREKGCQDKTLPERSKPCVIPYRLYFSGESSKWGCGGVAFIESKSIFANTYARQYLISVSQFLDVFRQENGIPYKTEIDESILFFSSKKGFADYGDSDSFKWYGKILYLGDDEGVARFTFTAKNDSGKRNPPSDVYLSILEKGLMESHGLTANQIHKYLNL